MPDRSHDEAVEAEAQRLGPAPEQRMALRDANRGIATAAAVEGMLLVAVVAGALVLVGLVLPSVGFTIAGFALLVVLIGGLAALALAHRDLEGRPRPFRR